MEYTHLGRSGLTVSRLCLGTMNFGSLTSPDEAHLIMDRARELGLNFFDTAKTVSLVPLPETVHHAAEEGQWTGC